MSLFVNEGKVILGLRQAILDAVERALTRLIGEMWKPLLERKRVKVTIEIEDKDSTN